MLFFHHLGILVTAYFILFSEEQTSTLASTNAFSPRRCKVGCEDVLERCTNGLKEMYGYCYIKHKYCNDRCYQRLVRNLRSKLALCKREHADIAAKVKRLTKTYHLAKETTDK